MIIMADQLSLVTCTPQSNQHGLLTVGLLASTDPLTVVVQAPAPGPPLCLLLK
jgi:hypothetical protein